MKVILNAGHTLYGKGTGAVGYINESIETRKVVNLVKNYLQEKGHEVIVVNVDKATTQTAYLYEVVKKSNAQKNVDLFVSVHFNAANGRAQGTECYSWKGEKTPQAVGICAELSALGFRNRGVKNGSNLYVVRNTYMPATLVEVCFCDTKADVDLYKKLGVNKVAQAITRGILKR